MTDNIFEALGELSLHVGMRLMGKAMPPDHANVGIDRTALANAVLDSCVEQASLIVGKLGVIYQLNDERGDFGVIVGIIAREQLGLIEALTGTQLSLTRDCSRSVGETCMRAVLELRG